MPSAVRLLRASELAETPYAYAATAPPDARLIFLAGSCPLDADGATVAPGDYRSQARRCVDNLVTALHAAGAAGLQDVLSTRVLVASSRRQDLLDAWDEVHARFGSHDVPSTLLGVTVLGYEDQLVEVEAVAAVVDQPAVLPS